MSLSSDHLNQTQIISPFMSCIVECRSKMKKLRKKIYKNLKAKQNASPSSINLKKKLSVEEALREEKIPTFLASAIKDLKKEDGLRDITNFSLTQKVDYDSIRGYADGQEKEVQLILQNIHSKPPNLPFQEFQSDEEISTLNRLKSRQWLQSTEMEYQDEQMMERHSKITLKPFELFPNSEDSQRQISDNHLREANGFITLDNGQLFEHNLFHF